MQKICLPFNLHLMHGNWYERWACILLPLASSLDLWSVTVTALDVYFLKQICLNISLSKGFPADLHYNSISHWTHLDTDNLHITWNIYFHFNSMHCNAFIQLFWSHFHEQRFIRFTLTYLLKLTELKNKIFSHPVNVKILKASK